MDGVFGREDVLAHAWTALTTLAERRAVLVEGPAGIGKTAVLRELRTRAQAAGHVVLHCAPAEAEQGLPLAALADLLQPLHEHAGSLPDPQRAAIRAALLLGEAAVDERALAAGARRLIEDAAERAGGRLLVAVDDAPWLDPPSERALRFVLRRLTGVSVLVGARTAATDVAPLGLDALSRQPFRIALPPLRTGALHHAIADRFGASLSRPLLARVAEESGGNPLLALELTRALLRLPSPPGPADELPVARSVQELVAATLAGMTEPSRAAVRLAALLSAPGFADVVAAGAAPDALAAAEEHGLITVATDGRIRFGHPAYASAVRAAMTASARRELHAALASAVSDPDERARHLAQSSTVPDAEVAAQVADAAGRVRRRGGPDLAAGLYERAAELTPPGDAAASHARRLAAVECRFDAGDYASAGAQADALAAQVDGAARVEVLLLRGAIAWSQDDVNAALAAANAALAEAPPGTAQEGRIHAELAVYTDEPRSAAAHAKRARRLLDPDDPDDLGDPGGPATRATVASAMMLQFYNEVRAGLPARLELLDEALAIEGTEPSRLAGTVPAIFWKGVDAHDRARARLLGMYDRALAWGDEPFQHELLTHLAEAELTAGRYADAARWIAAARELGEQLGTGLVGETWLAGLLDAHAGDVDRAAATAAEGLRVATATDDWWRRRIHLLLAGAAALTAQRYGDAAAAFTELAAAIDAAGLIEPLATRFEADWVEACVGAGDLATAARALQRLRERHARLPRPWTSLGLARSEVLLVGAERLPVEEALDALTLARDAVPEDVVPLDRARCLLVAGVAHRRAKRKRAARDALEGARREFEALGAVPYAARAAAEIARLGVRTESALELSATEARIAELAGQGRTNRVIADLLFVSPKTVEANLARVYRKLGIATRAELGAAMAGDRETPDSSRAARP